MELTIEQMDEFLRPEKGWIRNASGYEYVYDYHMNNIPVIIKVASTVQTEEGQKTGKRNKGSDRIRVFSVVKHGMSRSSNIKKGLLKKRALDVDEDVFTNLQALVMEVIDHSKKRYKHQNN